MGNQDLLAINIRSAFCGGYGTDCFSVTGGRGFNSLTEVIVNNLIAVGGLVCVGYIIYGGFLIIQGADSPQKVEQGRQIITWSILGFILLFSSYWFLKILSLTTGLNLTE